MARAATEVDFSDQAMAARQRLLQAMQAAISYGDIDINSARRLIELIEEILEDDE